jgi:AcrR family transcriptional regulator
MSRTIVRFRLASMPRISELRRHQRRQEILDAARAEFTSNGFHATSMDDIIRAAGMSPGGVYRYFAGKEAIIAAIAGQAVGELTATVDQILAEQPAPVIAAVLRGLVIRVDDLADGPGRLALMVWGEAQRDPSIARLAATEISRVRDRMACLFRGARDAGELSAHADPTALGQAAVSLIAGYLVQKRVVGDIDPIRYADAIETLLTARPGPGEQPGF